MLNKMQIFLFSTANSIILNFLSSIVMPFLKRQVKRTDTEIDDELVEWLDKCITLLESKI